MSKINRGGRQTQSSTYVQIDLAGQVPLARPLGIVNCASMVYTGCSNVSAALLSKPITH